LLEGKTVNLRIVEREDLPLLADWNNNSEYYGFEFMWLSQQSKTEWEKRYDNLTADTKWFFIEKKDGTKIGEIGHFMFGKLLEIYYYLVQSERGKGYGTEAIMIMVDYLFLSRELMRVQATTDVSNIVSQRVLEKVGFTKEGIIRKSNFNRGKWRDDCLYSILREEWKEPKILTKTTS
jgi:RimJ/RimL family protein N-acetyltransferase